MNPRKGSEYGEPTIEANSGAHDRGRKEDVMTMILTNDNHVERPIRIRLPLQFFAEGAGEGGNAGQAAGGTEAGSADTGAVDTSATPTETPEKGKTYTSEDAAAVAKQFKMVPHNAVKERYKTTFDKAGKYDAMSEHMTAVAEWYGVSLEDPEGLAKAILNDKALVKAKASELGVTEDVAQSLVEADAQNALNRAKEAVRVRQQEYSRMAEEERIVTETYPTFNFSKAAENKAFKALVDSGHSMKEAYEMSHHAELMTAAINAAKEEIRAEVRAEMEAAARRPKEGAAGQSVNSPTDVGKLHGAALDAFLESFLTK